MEAMNTEANLTEKDKGKDIVVASIYKPFLFDKQR